jgi:hypothetical protein
VGSRDVTEIGPGALSAYRHRSISLAMRNPQGRNSGPGGHQPWTACWSRNPATTAGKKKRCRLKSLSINDLQI